MGIRARKVARKMTIFLGLQKPPSPVISVLALGQSNMEGCFGPPDPAMEEPDERVRVWDLDHREWKIAALGKPPFRRGNPVPNNLAYVFCRKLAQNQNAIVHLVLLASGGKKIEFFLPEAILSVNGWRNEQECAIHGSSIAPALFDDEGHGKMALRSINRSAFDVLLVHQGEANFSNAADMDTAESYTAKLRSLLTESREHAIIGDKTQIILGNINAAYRGAAKHALALENFRNPRCEIAPWEGIQTVKDICTQNNLHATGKGLQLLGERYYSRYLSSPQTRISHARRVAGKGGL